MEKITDDQAFLIERAKNAAMWGRSYSGSRVGVAVSVVENNDKIYTYTGANLSNASPALTMCAERMALQNASAAGCRSITEIAIYSPDYEMISPCGLCRQVIMELAVNAQILVWMGGISKDMGYQWESHTIGELLPFAYKSQRARVS